METTGKANCGPVCLQYILEHFGVNMTAEALATEMGTTEPAGTTAQAIVTAANAHGVVSTAHFCDIAALEQSPKPSIIHWGGNHFLVLEMIQGNVVCVKDPSSNRRTIHRKELAFYYSGVELRFIAGA